MVIKFKNVFLSLIFLILFIFTISFSSAVNYNASAGTTKVYTCGNIISFGNYSINQTINNGTGSCLVILADNVILDGKENTINFNNTITGNNGTAINVSGTRNNVTIKNLSIVINDVATNSFLSGIDINNNTFIDSINIAGTGQETEIGIFVHGLNNTLRNSPLSGNYYDIQCDSLGINTNDGLTYDQQFGCDSWIYNDVLFPGPISTCGTISLPGTYTLQNNINPATGTYCFNILVSNLTLNLNSFNITGDKTGEAITISGSNNTIIENGGIYNFSAGIDILCASDTTLESQNITIKHIDSSFNAGNGITLCSDYSTLTNVTTNSNIGSLVKGIELDSSFNNLTNIISNSNTFSGMHMNGASNNTITNFVGNSNALDNGIDIEANSNYNIFTNITTNSDYSGGLYVSNGCENNAFANIISNSNLRDGISVFSNSNKFTNVTANLNQRHGILLYLSYNVLENITVNSNNESGIFIDITSSFNNLTNVITSNNTDGVNVSSSSNNNYIFNLIAYNNTNREIDDLSSSNSLNYLIYNNSFGRIDFTNSSFLDNLTLKGTLTFPGNIVIANGNVYLNSSAFGGKINSSANVALYNINSSWTFIKILSNGGLCDSGICNFISWNYSSGTAIINVSSWANYTIAQALVPKVNLISPNNNTSSNNNPISFNGTFSAGDSMFSLKNATLYIWNSTGDLINSTTNSIVGISNSSNISIALPYNGVFAWNYLVYDNNSDYTFNSTNWTVTFDSISPTINFTSPSDSNGTVLARNNILVNVTASDSGSGLKNITINLYNSTGLVNSTTLSTAPLYLNFTNLPNGNYYINSTVYDNAGNYNNTETRIVIIFVDILPPTISVLYPQNTSYNYSISTLNYSASDNYLYSCWYSTNNGLTNSTPSIGCANFTGLSAIQGSNNWTVYANDTSNNVNSTSVMFFVDSINPRASITMDTSNIEYGFGSKSITWNVTDANPLSSIFNVTYSDGTLIYSSTTLNGTINLTSSDLIFSGIYNVTLWANDTIGNNNITKTSFFVNDTLPPNIILISPANNSDSTDTSQTFSYNITDESTTNCSLILDGINTNFNSSVNITDGTNSFVNSTVIGNHNWSVSCADILGNKADSSTFVFSISEVVVPSGGNNGGGGSSGGNTYPSFNITNEQFIIGYTKLLYSNWIVNFKLGSNGHALKVNSVGINNISITLSSLPLTSTLKIKESKLFDLDSNNYYDTYVTLNSINNGGANITIKSANLIVNNTISPGNVITDENISSGENVTPELNANSGNFEGKVKLWYLLIIVILVIIILMIVVGFIIWKKRKSTVNYY